MTDRYELMNKLFQWIVMEQAGNPPPKEVLDKEPYLREVKNAIEEIAARICYSTNQNKYETQVSLAKLFTSGLVELSRGDDGVFRIKSVDDPNIAILEEFNDKLRS